MSMGHRIQESLTLRSRGESSSLEGGGEKSRKRALQVAAWQEHCAGGQNSDPERVAPGEMGRTQPLAASLTFVQGGQFQGDADDPNQILRGDKGA